MSTTTAFISVKNVIEDAAQELRDDDTNKGGWPFYRSAAQRALQDLCYDAMWDERAFDKDVPANRILQLPEGLIGLKNVWLYNGDNCNINFSAKLFIKPNMIHKGGTGFFANNKGNGGGDLNSSPFGQNLQWGGTWPGNSIYYAGYSNGFLYLSDTCLQYPRIHIEYNGLGMENWGDDFDIPQWAREAVTDYVILKVALRLYQEDPKYYGSIINRKEALTSTGNTNGTWCRALARWNRMDEKERQDIIVQTTRLGHGLGAYGYGGYGGYGPY